MSFFTRSSVAVATLLLSLLGSFAQAHDTNPPRRAASQVAGTAQVAVAPLATTEHPDASTQLVTLSGTVLGADGLPCAGACVYPPASPRQMAVTDAHGVFHLQVPVSTQQLQADYFGLGSSRIALDNQHIQPVHIVLGQ